MNNEDSGRVAEKNRMNYEQLMTLLDPDTEGFANIKAIEIRDYARMLRQQVGTAGSEKDHRQITDDSIPEV